MDFDKVTLYKKIVSLLDLTSLNETDNESSIMQLCQKAKKPWGMTAGICVYPRFVKQVATLLKETPINIMTVANFPDGKDTLDSVIPSIEQALNDGANEIDVVFPYTQYGASRKKEACDFITQCKKTCGQAVLKVILETGAIDDSILLRNMAQDAILAGADFLKTSTGKIAKGASLETAAILLSVIQHMKQTMDKEVGLKIAGGIRTIEDALPYLQLIETVMGSDWIIPKHVRIGSRSLGDGCK